MKEIKVKNTRRLNVGVGSSSSSVRVENRNTPSLTAVADDARELSAKDWKLARKLSKMQRRIDKQYAKLHDDYDVAGRMVMLTAREYRQTIKLANTLRQSDKALAKAQKVEKKAKQARFDKAQLEVR